MLMSRLHGIAADVAQLQHQYGRGPFTTQTILLAARKLGMKARQVQQDPARLDRVPLPAIGVDRAGDYFVLGKVDTAQDPARVLIQRPGQATEVLAMDRFRAQWTGNLSSSPARPALRGDG